ncbi:Zinc Finger And Scan Domain-Containing Protein 1 [Manis pentadactyla]|nr:Zinc Finger And Scan Domain-Containing Protein 1 [Manis pentadactyla]
MGTTAPVLGRLLRIAPAQFSSSEFVDVKEPKKKALKSCYVLDLKWINFGKAVSLSVRPHLPMFIRRQNSAPVSREQHGRGRGASGRRAGLLCGRCRLSKLGFCHL